MMCAPASKYMMEDETTGKRDDGGELASEVIDVTLPQRKQM